MSQTLVLRRRRLNRRRRNSDAGYTALVGLFAVAAVGALGYGLYRALRKPKPSYTLPPPGPKGTIFKDDLAAISQSFPRPTARL